MPPRRLPRGPLLARVPKSGRSRVVYCGGLRSAPSSPRPLLSLQQPLPPVTSSPLEGRSSLLGPEGLLPDRSLRPLSLEARGLSRGRPLLRQLSPPDCKSRIGLPATVVWGEGSFLSRGNSGVRLFWPLYVGQLRSVSGPSPTRGRGFCGPCAGGPVRL